MQNSSYKRPRDFSNKKVSVVQTIKILKRNGIEINEDQASEILDFLYLIAKTFKRIENTEYDSMT